MENSQGKCADCGSFDVEYGTIQIQDGSVYYPYKCNNCQNTGKEWYNLRYVETVAD